MKRINILFIFIFSVPSATFSQQSYNPQNEMFVRFGTKRS